MATDTQLASGASVDPAAITGQANSSNTTKSAPESATAAKAGDKTSPAIATAFASDRGGSASLVIPSSTSIGDSASSTSGTHATSSTSSQNLQSARQLADRVADTLRNAFDTGGELRVRLEPPSLGKIQIDVQQADSGVVSARLEVQTPAARQTLLDNISLLHDAIGQTGATVSRIDIEVAPQQHNPTGSDHRHGTSGGSQQDSGNSNSQGHSGTSGGGQKQSQGRWRTSAIDEIDIEV